MTRSHKCTGVSEISLKYFRYFYSLQVYRVLSSRKNVDIQTELLNCEMNFTSTDVAVRVPHKILNVNSDTCGIRVSTNLITGGKGESCRTVFLLPPPPPSVEQMPRVSARERQRERSIVVSRFVLRRINFVVDPGTGNPYRIGSPGTRTLAQAYGLFNFVRRRVRSIRRG